MAKILGGRKSSYRGSIQCWGHEVSQFDPRNRVAVFEQNRRPKSISLDQLFKGDDWTVEDEALRLLALDWADIPNIDLNQRHDQLSEGQRQKADLALFFFGTIRDKRIYAAIIDEPTNHVSEESRARVAKGISQFKEMFESTLLVISHDPVVTRECRVLSTVVRW